MSCEYVLCYCKLHIMLFYFFDTIMTEQNSILHVLFVIFKLRPKSFGLIRSKNCVFRRSVSCDADFSSQHNSSVTSPSTPYSVAAAAHGSSQQGVFSCFYYYV